MPAALGFPAYGYADPARLVRPRKGLGVGRGLRRLGRSGLGGPGVILPRAGVLTWKGTDALSWDGTDCVVWK